MLSFGLVTEGPTDQVVIENILFGIFNNPDLFINRLQPAPDEPGNWDKVFKYCASDEFKVALPFNDYLIVQVDTDVLISDQISKEYKLELPSSLSIEEIINRVVEFLISLINDENNFWEKYGHKIIFAISVHQLECWLLPIYFSNKKAKSAKITGCIDTLNEVLLQKEGFIIHAKDLGYYKKMSKHFRKNIHKIFHLNPSLKVFVERVLEIKNKDSK